MSALNSPAISDHLYAQIATHYIDRARFVGKFQLEINNYWI